MVHFKITGILWLVLSLSAAAIVTPQLWSMAAGRDHGLGSGYYDPAMWASQFLIEGFLLLDIAVGVGLIRLKRWAAICIRMTGVLLLLYCLSFVLMGEFEHFDAMWLVAALFGIALAAYSLFVVWKFKPYYPSTPDHARAHDQ